MNVDLCATPPDITGVIWPAPTVLVLTLVVGIWAIVAGVSEITAAWLPLNLIIKSKIWRTIGHLPKCSLLKRGIARNVARPCCSRKH